PPCQVLHPLSLELWAVFLDDCRGFRFCDCHIGSSSGEHRGPVANSTRWLIPKTRGLARAWPLIGADPGPPTCIEWSQSHQGPLFSLRSYPPGQFQVMSFFCFSIRGGGAVGSHPCAGAEIIVTRLGGGVP